MKTLRSASRLMLLAVLAAVLPLGAGRPAQAQDAPSQRQMRTYIPPDQLVSFRPETPFSQFVDFLNPIFDRVTGKQVIDPESRTEAIGISIAGMHYMDALELVLEMRGLTYRETDRFFLIEPVPQTPDAVVELPGAEPGEIATPIATLDTREIQINAVLFSVNATKARDLGLDWNVFFGGATAAGVGGDLGSGDDDEGSGNSGTPGFFVRTNNLAEAVEDFIIIPRSFSLTTVTRFFRLLETEGVGETVANPRLTVQSGETGRIQIGTDFPFVTRDFSGNTITQFVSTGIIVNVTPTYFMQAIADTAGSPMLDFIHLDVDVENSNGQVSPGGPIVSRSSATTQIVLLDGEQTIIGGLFSTEDQVNRRGIPVLKDLPGWFFGIRYLTGVTQTTQIQRELIILLEARLVDPLRARADRPFEQNHLDQRREEVRRTLRGIDEQVPRNLEFPEAELLEDEGSER